MIRITPQECGPLQALFERTDEGIEARLIKVQ
jgi:hypothetical protein